MTPTQRLERIKELVAEQEKVSVNELKEYFDVTEETIRRDLQKLEKEGVVKRIHGGAILNKKHLREYAFFAKREAAHSKAKELIAQKALTLIKDGHTVMADSSSTSLYTIRACHQTRKITAISSSTKLLQDFDGPSTVQIISTGGVYDFRFESFTGSLPLDFVRNYNVDLAFIGCKAIHISKGIMDSTEAERSIKREMANQASKVCLLVDSSKFSKVGFVTLFAFDEIDYLITDREPVKEWRDFLASKDVQLLY